jgi:hypothetical protein
MTMSVGEIAPAPTALSRMLRPLTASRFWGTPSFEPGPSCRAVNGVASASSSAVVPIAKTTGRRMIVPASLAQKLRWLSSRRSMIFRGTRRTRSSRSSSQ